MVNLVRGIDQQVLEGSQICLELLGCWMGASPTLLQAAEFESWEPTCDRLGDFEGPHALPVGGMQQVINTLVSLLPEVQVQLNSEVRYYSGSYNITAVVQVTQIAWGGTGVTIHTSRDLLPIRADLCVCTLPIGVLKRAIDSNDTALFEPALPLKKQQAIRRIGVSG